LAVRFQTQSELHTFKVIFPKDCPTVLADEARLTQAISNLLSNAVKYSPEGGEITITGRVEKEDIVMCISDEGPGIALEDVPRIFDLFYRSNEVSRKTKGAGLGLFLAKAVIEAHGGHIWVDNRAKEGARICFTIPQNLN
jgi:signal transduction histidine kinase